jgi:flavin reductase (DIM6/NTAB) family NADH-FMN oxidoreductase RutF
MNGQNGFFTVKVPSPDMERVMDFCGSQSGRDVDKIRELGLAASPAKMVPGENGRFKSKVGEHGIV